VGARHGKLSQDHLAGCKKAMMVVVMMMMINLFHKHPSDSRDKWA
jgi:hypothetical protein